MRGEWRGGAREAGPGLQSAGLMSAPRAPPPPRGAGRRPWSAPTEATSPPSALPPSRPVRPPQRRHRILKLLLAVVLRAGAAGDALNVVLRHKDDDHVRVVDAGAHLSDYVALHPLVVKADAQAWPGRGEESRGEESRGRGGGGGGEGTRPRRGRAAPRPRSARVMAATRSWARRPSPSVPQSCVRKTSCRCSTCWSGSMGVGRWGWVDGGGSRGQVGGGAGGRCGGAAAAPAATRLRRPTLAASPPPPP